MEDYIYSYVRQGEQLNSANLGDFVAYRGKEETNSWELKNNVATAYLPLKKYSSTYPRDSRSSRRLCSLKRDIQ